MGYDIHITRATDWMDSDDTPISRAEWAKLVESDPSIVPDPENGPDDFLFTGRPEGPWGLWWYRGRVYTKNPDDLTIAKMLAIASVLGAHVQGDEGEQYVLAASGDVEMVPPT